MCGRRALRLAVLLALLGHAAAVWEMTEARSCRGQEKAYAACEGLPACEKPCEPTDCVFAAWGDWFEDEGCSGLCVRHRSIKTPNSECGGAPCEGPKVESKSCPKAACQEESQDCAVSTWSDWSACSSPLDQRHRSRALLAQPKGLGQPCSASMNETRPCTEQQPVDCQLSEWQQWTKCSSSCGSGYSAAMRKIVRHAENGGLSCQGALRKTEPCNVETCPGKVQDCKLGAWADWSGCDFSSPQQQFRTREVAVPALGRGKACSEALKETRGCSAEPPEDCVLSDWSAWRECDKTCGGGQTYRQRSLLSEPKRGGQCAQLSKLSETAPCNAHSCIPEMTCALVPWSDWSACSATCDVGTRERSREMVHGQAREQGSRRLSLLDDFAGSMVDAGVEAGAVNCTSGFSGGLREVAPCVSQACHRQDCLWDDWAAWSDCSISCDGGTRERSRLVKTPPGIGGAPCDPSDVSEIAACNTEPCSICVDGAWGDWSEWSGCSASCDRGLRSRHRDITRHPNHCGMPVTGMADDFEMCHAELPCVVDIDCELGDWGAWSSCSDSCFGLAERQRAVVTYPKGNGKVCSKESLKEVEMCNPRSGESIPLACEGSKPPSDCQLSTWNDWGVCSSSCGTGQAARHRSVLSPASEKGQLCNGTLSELRACSLMACPAEACVDCAYSDWSEWGACSQCGGQRFRHRSVQRLPNECGRQCALEETKQAGECSSECEEERWCAWSGWSDYGDCTAECGPASRTRQRGLSIFKERPTLEEPLFSFRVSSNATCQGTQVDSVACNLKSCRTCEPVDCQMGDWSEWSEPSCSQLCERTRTTQRHGSCGGQPCSGTTVETKECPKVCETSQDCLLSNWGSWSQCESPSSQRTRSREILQDAWQGGQPCQGRLSETQPCATPGLPVPCELSVWSAWADCTKSCLGGLTQRTRGVRVAAANGGAPCQGGLQELSLCNPGHCSEELQDCSFSSWSEWTECSPGGQRSRERSMEPSTGGGEECSGALHELQECSLNVDCELSEWSEWGVCDRPCAGGQQLRHRMVVKNPVLDGKACEPGLVETRGCNQESCNAVDCEVGDWTAWSQCTATCGTAQRQRQRRILSQPSGGGLGCGLELSQVEACANAACEYVDCLWSDWADWSDCSSRCGGGQHSRAREVVRSPQLGGRPCVPLHKEEIGSCNQQSCDGNCVDGAWGDWEEWSACSSSCQGGITHRSRPVDREANHCGRPAVGPMRESASCNVGVACYVSVDCLFGDWGAWSSCSGSCGGTKRRSRSIAVHGQGDGSYCVGPMKETAPCNPEVGEPVPSACQGPVPVDCRLATWGDWGVCSASCGGGSRSRERQLLAPPAHGGQECEHVLAEVEGCARRPCSLECEPQDCALGDWGEWSACDKCGGERRRFRPVLQEAKCGGAPCKPSASEEVSNCTRQCHEPAYCAWGDWREWSACTATCGAGEKVRLRHLQVISAEQLPSQPADVQMDAVDQIRLKDSINSLEELARSMRVRRVQNLSLAFASGGLSLVAGLVVLRAVVRSWPCSSHSGFFQTLPPPSEE